MARCRPFPNFSPASGLNGTVVAISRHEFPYDRRLEHRSLRRGAGKRFSREPDHPDRGRVSVGATFGPITVSVGGLTAYSGQVFEPTFNGGSFLNLTSFSSFAPSFNIDTQGGPGSTLIERSGR